MKNEENKAEKLTYLKRCMRDLMGMTEPNDDKLVGLTLDDEILINKFHTELTKQNQKNK